MVRHDVDSMFKLGCEAGTAQKELKWHQSMRDEILSGFDCEQIREVLKEAWNLGHETTIKLECYRKEAGQRGNKPPLMKFLQRYPSSY